MFHVKQRSAVLTYPESQELPLTRKIVVRAAGFASPGDGNCAKPLTPVGRGGAAAPLPPFFSPPARGRGRKDGASKLLSGLTSGRAPCRMARSFPLLCCHPGPVPGSRPSGTAPEHFSTGYDRSPLLPGGPPHPGPLPHGGEGDSRRRFALFFSPPACGRGRGRVGRSVRTAATRSGRKIPCPASPGSQSGAGLDPGTSPG